MLTEIINIPDQAKAWVYQSERAFTNEEIEIIKSKLASFISSWESHGTKLQASFVIEYNQFIVLTVDENMAGASGCSIDKSVAVMKEIEASIGVSLLDKTNVAFLEGENLITVHFQKIKSSIQEGVIKENTIVFNNTVTTFGDFKSNWKVKAKDSWMKRFFELK